MLKSLKDVRLSNGIAAYQAQKVEQAKTILEIDHHILAAKRNLGNGQIIQTAFSLGDEPLSVDKSYDKLLQKVIPFNTINNANRTNSLDGSNTYSNELFPTFQVSTMLLVFVIILYIVIVGPLLYIILKKKDKREFAWWMIPSLSLFVSILVFAYGAKDRLSKPQIQQSAVYKINQDDSLTGYYVNSLLTNRSGDFRFKIPPNSTAILIRNFNNIGSIHKQGIIEQYQNEKEITLRNNRYWSVSTIAGQTQIPNVGSFQIDLEVKDRVIKGNITNNLPYTVKNVSIWYGSQWLKIGTMKPNQTLKVTQTINGALLIPATPIITNNVNTVKNKDDIMDNRKQMLKESAYGVIENTEEPAIVGWIDDSITPISMKNGKADLSAINLVIQSFNPKTNFSGEFVLPTNSMSFEINPISNAGYAEQSSENSTIWSINEGVYEFKWKIPDTLQNKKFKWTELQMANTDTKNVTLQILNDKTFNYEPIKDGRFTLTKNIENYISNNGEVKFKLERKGSDNNKMAAPTLQLKGEVKP